MSFRFPPPRSRRSSLSIAVLIPLVIVPAGCGDQSKVKGDATAGRVLAERNCSTCHAIGPSKQSPVPAAPPFNVLANQYKPDDLAEAFAEGIQVGHGGSTVQMPEFRFEPQQVDDLIAYLNTLRSGE